MHRYSQIIRTFADDFILKHISTMKDFFKYMLATMCGILVMTIIGGLLLALTIMGILASSDSKVKAKENSVFVLKLNGTVTERSEDAGPMGLLLGAANAEEIFALRFGSYSIVFTTAGILSLLRLKSITRYLRL